MRLTEGLRSKAVIGHRFVLMFGGEGLQSLFGFGLSVGTARLLSARDFGLFSIVVLIGGVAVTYMRALAGVPAAIFIPQSRNARQVSALLITFGTAAVAVALVLGALSAALTGLMVRGSPDALPEMAWAATYVALWSVRSFVRNVALIERRLGVTLGGDFVFTLLGAVCAYGLASIFGARLEAILAALAIASLCSIATILVLDGKRPRLSLRRSVVRRYLELWPGLGWSAFGVTAANLQAQGQMALVALIAGPAAYAPIAAGLTLLAPLRLAASASVNLIQPDLSFAVGRPDARVGRVILWSSVALAGLGSLYGGALQALLPTLQHLLFAGRFDDQPMRLIVWLLLAVCMIVLLYSPPRTLLESLGAFRRLAAISGVGVAVGLPTVLAFLHWGSPAWSLTGLLLSEVAVLAGCWVAIGAYFASERRSMVHV